MFFSRGIWLTVTPGGGALGGTNGDGAIDEWGCTGAGVTAAYDNSAPYDVTITIPAGGVVTCKPSNSTNHLITNGYYAGLSSLGLAVA